MKRAAPTWESASKNQTDQLYLFNSLTKQKELFTPINGKHISWYTCGPTVYDESHMGHARCYISFDILRRVLQDYFKYDIKYCMNITDIDDKIIIKARKDHLFKEYVKKGKILTDVLIDVGEALKLTEEKFKEEQDKDKKEMYNRLIVKTKTAIENLNKTKAATDEDKKELIESSNDVLCTWLDKKEGKNVTDNSIFAKLPRHYEDEFHKDMSALKILPATIVTRVSEYVPEIIAFIEKIITNGFGYESNGSVYFDTIKFDKTPNHYYAKLVPEAFGDSKALAEGEGALTDEKTPEKRNETDFALWKMSKPGEPSWDSPWGKGRPGWHIECSAMAGSIFSSQIDIHSGGIDLKFPHHDNEIAQSEAAYCNNNWVNFFLHSGHLHIQGCKMSKSLKNFITIKDALKSYTSKQLRILFLLHSWKDTLDYSNQGMDAALSFEKSLREFFLRLKDFSRDVKFDASDAFVKLTLAESALLKNFEERKALVHKALCDSINTPIVMKEISNLITTTNIYMTGNYNLQSYNHVLVRDIAIYITNLMKVFGVIESNDLIGFQSASSGDSANKEQTLMPYLNALSSFRDEVRAEARDKKAFEILSLCDNLRDNVLPDLGVLLEDLSDRTVVKLVDKEILIKEREQKLLAAQRKAADELKRKQDLLEAKREKEAKKSIPPQELFVKELDKYSKFDENGIPTHDTEGKELTKSGRKKLEKIYETQVKSYEEFLKNKQINNGIES